MSNYKNIYHVLDITSFSIRFVTFLQLTHCT
ncbi:hypothetical protein ACJIZ3_006464 [Penstemon smallii]|uniref:Uncharacterized protein n=1 Tax=Penstemon smallii TaxID=265156 RepID=A0ABD3S7X5_9LAMI